MRQRSSRTPKPPAGPAFDAGLRLLAIRAHSRVELRRKLDRRGYASAELDATIARLSELGYLDDVAFAAGHVRRRASTRGSRALSAELAARGVPRDVAAAALDGLDGAAELAAATRLAERMCAGARPAGFRELLNSVGPRLLRRGFSERVARAACAEAWRRTEPGPQA